MGTSALGTDPISSDVKAIVKSARKLRKQSRLQILRRVDRQLRDGAVESQRNRIAAARLLIACLPDSIPLIQRWMEIRQGRWNYEMQFSLFCFLSDAQSINMDRSIIERLQQLVLDYLLSARTTTAKAAWMAGHLLGEHWKGPESLPLLLTVSHRGRYSAGRRAAIQGLEKQFERSNEDDRTLIIEALRSVSNADKSRRLRNQAQRLLRKLTKSRDVSSSC